MLTTTNLVGYQQAEFDCATRYATWRLVLQLLVALPAALSVFVESDPLWTYGLALAGALLLFGYAWLEHLDRKHTDAGQRARRALLVMEGLGQPLSAEAQLDILAGFRVGKAAAAKRESADYYASVEAAGPMRLAEIIEESAFWTSRLHQAGGFLMVAVFSTFALVAAIACAIALPFIMGPALLILARIFLVLLVFGLSADAWGSIVGHFAAARETEAIRTRIACIRARSAPLPDVMLAMVDYNSAVEAAPPHVMGLHGRMRAHLNDLWATYQQSRAGACQ